MNIQTIKPEINPYIIAIQSKKFTDLPKKEAVLMLLDIFGNMYFEVGQEPQHMEYQKLMADKFHREISESFTYLKTEELKLIFKNGVRKVYGDFFGLNIATFHQWIKAYTNSKERTDAQRELKNRIPNYEKPVMSEAEANKAWEEAIKKQFKTFKETGTLNIAVVNFQYKKFIEKGLLKETDFHAYMESAKRHILESKKYDRIKAQSFERTRLTDLINRFETNTTSQQDDEVIIQQAKKETITNFYRSITNLNI